MGQNLVVDYVKDNCKLSDLIIETNPNGKS